MTRSLYEDHCNSDVFRRHIYHHHQGESYTERWDTASMVKSLLLRTHY
jgi:hypothetical protein